MDTEVRALLDAQGVDGGWGYRAQSTSWTEPTALCLLALRGTGAEAASARGRTWLLRSQRTDGGWAPQRCVDESTWVTSLAMLALAGHADAAGETQGRRWLLRQTGRPGTALDRIRGWLAGQPLNTAPEGWPWYPGTASWVIPTSMSILTLKRWRSDGEVRQRIRQGQDYLLMRQCAEGGWNHGGSRILSEDAQPYPDTTGIALLSLRGVADRRLTAALERAERLSIGCDSREGTTWLRLGLAAHGRLIPPAQNPSPAAQETIAAQALRLIASQSPDAFLAESV